MSELKPCPFCGSQLTGFGQDVRNGVVTELYRHPTATGCALASLIFSEAQWNKRHDPNPWRYPAKGELPTQQRSYIVTDRYGRVWECKWTDAGWKQDGHLLADDYIRAWKHKPEPAPELEVTE